MFRPGVEKADYGHPDLLCMGSERERRYCTAKYAEKFSSPHVRPSAQEAASCSALTTLGRGLGGTTVENAPMSHLVGQTRSLR